MRSYSALKRSRMADWPLVKLHGLHIRVAQVCGNSLNGIGGKNAVVAASSAREG